MTHIEMAKTPKDAKNSKTTLTSIRIPPETLQALQRRAKRKNISQNRFIVSVLNQALGLSDHGFDPNPPLPTDEAIANLQARLQVVEQQLGIKADNPFVSEPMQDEEPLPILEAIKQTDQPLTVKQAMQYAIEKHGYEAHGKRPENSFSQIFRDLQKKGEPEEKYGLRRVKLPSKGKQVRYGYEVIEK